MLLSVKRAVIGVTLFLLHLNIYAQSSEAGKDCEKFYAITDYIQKDSSVKTYLGIKEPRFRIKMKVSKSAYSIFPFKLERQYLASLLRKDSAIVDWSSKEIAHLRDSLSNASSLANNSNQIECQLYQAQNPNLLLSFAKDDNAVEAKLDTNSKGWGKGIVYLFFFEKNRIKNVYKATFIE